MDNLKHQRIVILGGTSGIGLATAQAAAAAGAQVVVVSGNQERVHHAVSLLPEGTQGYVTDLTDETAIQQLFTQIGDFDHLVFTAGESLRIGEIKDCQLEDSRSYFNLRYWGAVAAVKYASAYIHPKGSVTLTSGIAGARPHKGWALGASICAAMEGFARAMAVELAPVRVNIVSPGIVKTNLWSDIPVDDREAMYKSVGAGLPVGRAGEAEDIAQTYLYLMRQAFCTGQTVVVDGGALLV